MAFFFVKIFVIYRKITKKLFFFMLSNSKIFEKQIQNLISFLFIIYSTFLKIFSKIFKISEKFFRIFLYFFPQNFNKYYSKLILFLIFAVLSRQFLSPLLIFYQVFWKFLNFFPKELIKSGPSRNHQDQYFEHFEKNLIKFYKKFEE